MVGRRPKPTQLKKLAGNPGKRPINKKEPGRIRSASLRVPKGRLPADAARLWRTLAPLLDEMGVLSDSDLPALEMLCLHYAAARKGWDELDKKGPTVIGALGGVKGNPAAAIFRQNSLAFKSYLTEFGLTPSSRVRLQVGDGGVEEKTLAEILFEAAQGDGISR